MSDSREKILARLREGRATAPFAREVAPLASSPVQPGSEQDWQTVAQALEPLNGRLLLADTAAEAAAQLRGILDETGAQRVARWQHPLLEELGLDAWLQDAGAQLVEPGSKAPTGGLCPLLAEADAGVTAVDALFALAGTLVLMAGAGRPRGMSLVPPVHIAFAPQSLLYADLSSLPGLLRKRLQEQGRLPSAVHLITGSSSTADIEQTLVRPAHGPALVRVIGLRWL